MKREIQSPITLRITAAEVLESQLQEDDLRALAPTLPARSGQQALCPKVYCEGGWCGVPAAGDVIQNPEKG